MKNNSGLLYGVLITTALLISINKVFASNCTGQGIELQVLGSGGPEVQDKRASSSYLIWQDGEARVLIDSGGGSALRFGQSGANMADLAVVLLTHLHADHSADLPALIKSSYFESRTKPLPIYGPAGNDAFPDTDEFIEKLFAEEGVFRYLSNFLSADSADYTIQPHTVLLDQQQINMIFQQSDIRVTAVSVVHGSVPALAWRVDIGGKSIAFSGDMNGESGNLHRLAKKADILVAHNAVPESARGAARHLHMPPSVIGQIAAQAQVDQLILSHRMLRTLGKEAETIKHISHYFDDTLVFADDLDCFSP